MLHKVIALNLYILTIKGRIYPLYRQGVQSLSVDGYFLGAEAQAVFAPRTPGTSSSRNQNSKPKINFGTQNLKFLTHLWYNINMGDGVPLYQYYLKEVNC